jgi:putative glutamine amidotransferase
VSLLSIKFRFMHKRPVIGIPTQTLEAMPDELPRCWVMSQRYVRVLTSAGAVPWIVPLLDDEATLRDIYDYVDGVFLPGGVDVDPASYGEARAPGSGRVDAERDRTELTLVRWAAAERKPVLGVCRGAQVINVAFGGTLYQDVAVQREGAIKHDYFPTGGRYTRDQLVHDVRVVEGTQLAAALGVPQLAVNSMHHQGIRDLAPGLVVSALAPDGLIEGVEASNGQYLIGVQWHPESLVDADPRMRRLFATFIEAACSFRDSRLMTGSLT